MAPMAQPTTFATPASPSVALCEGGLNGYNTLAMGKKQKVLIIVGPTSSGKSALAVELARKFSGEVISADSRQVYRGLNIGTGKITKREMKGVPHYLLDVASPKKPFSAHDYVTHATRAIGNIVCRGKLPIIAGGTGLYIDALTGRIAFPDVPPNPALRAGLEKKSAAELFAILEKRDPQRAKTMNSPSERNNKVRLIRALEITYVIGRVPKSGGLRNPHDALWIGIAPPLKELEKKITIRLSARISRGLIGEAKRLHTSGLSYKRMEELGLEYRALARLLRGKITRAQMIEELNRAIRKYAKRQMVYWKRNMDIVWFEKPTDRNIEGVIQNWLKN